MISTLCLEFSLLMISLNVSLPKAIKISSCKVYNTDENGYLNRFPTSIILQGSNDGSTWDTIGSLNNYSQPTSGSYVEVTVTTPTYYSYYKWLFGANFGGNSGVAISEIEINAVYQAMPSYFTTEANWQSSVSEYGVCGKFVYDSVNNTVRLPKVTGIIEGTTDISALGDLVEAGLPNITGKAIGNRTPYDWGGSNGVFKNLGNTTMASGVYKANNDTSTNAQSSTLGFDASGSSSIYGNSSTVQPQTIKAFYYIVIANSTKTEIQSDIDEIATDLNGKADVDLSNISASQSAKNEIISWGMPDYANGVTFTGTITLPCAALIWSGNGGNGSWVGCGFYVNNILFYNSSTYTSNVCTIADKGATVQAYEGTCIYYPLKGAN